MRESSLEMPYLQRRVTAARERNKLTQKQMAEKLGFKDRQTLTAIEAGERRISAEELVKLIKVTGCSLEFFTDPFRLVEEGAFSYRAAQVQVKVLDQFEALAGGWVALWRYLSRRRQVNTSPFRPKLSVDAGSTFEQAQAAGEAVAQALKLGPIPADRLAEALEEHLQILVLHVDMPKGVSGAAVQLPGGETILVNRQESKGRQAFDLAHELFHVLTWDALPPERVDRENPTGYKQKRTEQLADNFAGALLMPVRELEPRWSKLKEEGLVESLRVIASHFGVSPAAAAWRLAALGQLKKDRMPQNLPSSSGDQRLLASNYSRRFLEQILWGIDKGEVSLLRVLKVLGTDLETFKKDCTEHGLHPDLGL